jgi:hypothetical protein
MDLSQWFQQQLQTSAESFLWAVEQIPQERLYLPPRPDRWPVARLVLGHFSLTWVVAKTFQHTLEHTDEILRAYLWWR